MLISAMINGYRHPFRNGRLEIRSAEMLAPAAFLASAAFTFQLQNEILPASIRDLEDVDKTENVFILDQTISNRGAT